MSNSVIVNLTELRDTQVAGRLNLNAFVRGSPDKLSIWVGGLTKEDQHHEGGRASPIPEESEWSKKVEEGDFVLSDWAQCPSPALRLGVLAYWISGLLPWTKTILWVFLGPQLAEVRSWDFSASIIMWSNPWKTIIFPYISVTVYLCLNLWSISHSITIYILLVLSLWRTLTNRT
jgi:hypothetical protein